MLKNAYFLEKNVKNRLSVEDSAPEPSLAPVAGGCPRTSRVVTPAYYCNFFKFISSSRVRFITLKKEEYLLLPNFCTYFSLRTLKFFLTGGARIFLAQGRRVP